MVCGCGEGRISKVCRRTARREPSPPDTLARGKDKGAVFSCQQPFEEETNQLPQLEFPAELPKLFRLIEGV